MNTYQKFTLKAALELASPPTWVASIGPCCIAGAFAVCCWLVYALSGQTAVEQHGLAELAVTLDARSAACWVLMLCCAVLMQSATNTLNDYQDYKSGLDTAETIMDETDASIIYNHIDPRSALKFALALLGAAAALGVIVALLSSWWLVVWGLVAAAVVVLYSVGPKPISSLPLGEVVSGVVMGGIITCATFFAMTLVISPVVFALALIPTVAIAQIMQTNNTCDRDRDLAVGRRTLPGIVGQRRSSILNASLCLTAFLWCVVMLVWAELYLGILIVAVGFLVCLPKISLLLKGPYNLINRRVMMETTVSYNRWLYGTVVISLLIGGVVSVVI